jgi:hypothetical protein
MKRRKVITLAQLREVQTLLARLEKLARKLESRPWDFPRRCVLEAASVLEKFRRQL